MFRREILAMPGWLFVHGHRVRRYRGIHRGRVSSSAGRGTDGPRGAGEDFQCEIIESIQCPVVLEREQPRHLWPLDLPGDYRSLECKERHPSFFG